MNSKYRKYVTYTAAVGVLTLSSVLGGCTKKSTSEVGDATPSEVNVIPVSYTHLDVYKRQVHPWKIIYMCSSMAHSIWGIT